MYYRYINLTYERNRPFLINITQNFYTFHIFNDISLFRNINNLIINLKGKNKTYSIQTL